MKSMHRLLDAWRSTRRRAQEVLGMNQRNLNYVYPHNARRDFPLADDKIRTKELMRAAGVPTPETYRIYAHFYELRDVAQDLSGRGSFVIKPSQGRGGGGIMVIAEQEPDAWRGVNGRRIGLQEIRKHLSDIIFGVYSFDLSDRALIEERIVQDESMSVLSPAGLADVRVILYRDEPVLSMTRIPTRRSDGRANLHQGAVGAGIDLVTGLTVNAVLKGAPLRNHPDTEEPLVGRRIPFWTGLLDVARRAARTVPLKYLGVDIALARSGPVLLEINVRPGLEIQNANLLGLRSILEGRDG